MTWEHIKSAEFYPYLRLSKSEALQVGVGVGVGVGHTVYVVISLLLRWFVCMLKMGALVRGAQGLSGVCWGVVRWGD